MSSQDQIEQCKKEIAEFKAQIEAHRGDPEVDQPRTFTSTGRARARQGDHLLFFAAFLLSSCCVCVSHACALMCCLASACVCLFLRAVAEVAASQNLPKATIAMKQRRILKGHFGKIYALH